MLGRWDAFVSHPFARLLFFFVWSFLGFGFSFACGPIYHLRFMSLGVLPSCTFSSGGSAFSLSNPRAPLLQVPRHDIVKLGSRSRGCIRRTILLVLACSDIGTSLNFLDPVEISMVIRSFFLGCDKLWAGEVLQATMRCQRISVDRREVKKKPMDGSGRA